DQVLMLLRRAIEITLLINQPGDWRVRAKPVAQLLSAEPRRANKIRPPMIVRLGLVLLPLFQGGSADEDDPLAFRDVVARLGGQRENRQRSNQKEPFHAIDRKSTRLNSSHVAISYAVFCLKKKKKKKINIITDTEMVR